MPILGGLSFIVVIGIFIHIIITAILTSYNFRRSKTRYKYFALLYLLNLVLFITFIWLITNFVNIEKSLDVVAMISYSVITSYVLTIEIPGYIILSRYDEKLIDELQQTRRIIIMLNFDSSEFKNLKDKNQLMKDKFKEIYLDESLQAFIISYERISNVDKTLYGIIISEFDNTIATVSGRSKHPFPKLIETLSLAGISFLAAQFLNHFLG